jgi:hypothetical protein
MHSYKKAFSRRGILESSAIFGAADGAHRRRCPPTEVLLLLRDRVANDWRGLCRQLDVRGSTCQLFLRNVLEDLRDAGLIRFTKKQPLYTIEVVGRIEVSASWRHIQTALGVSLADMVSFSGGEAMIVKPCFGPPMPPPSKSDVFVLMPFERKLRRIYTKHIARVVRSLKLSAARADDFFSARSVMSDIWNAICAAKLVIADCTHRNPNVFYEIGLAHVIGKKVILLTQRRNDIPLGRSKDEMPFDVRHFRCIEYKPSPEGLGALEAALKRTIQTELGLAHQQRPGTCGRICPAK